MGIVYKQQHNPPTAAPTSVVPKQLQNRLGSGLAIPMQVTNNIWQILNGIPKVEQDMLVCLCTPVNRRLGQADYGSELPYLVFEAYNEDFVEEAILYTKGSLSQWVPQISVIQVDVSLSPSNVVTIAIQYSINGTTSFNILSLALTYDDSVQLPPGTFTLGGKQIIGQSGNFAGGQ